MISATMILYSIVFRNMALRAAYGNTLLSAVHSLLAYCQRTWVSGKMMRTVSRLNGLIQGTFDESASKSAEETNNQAHDRQQGHNHDGSRWRSRATCPPLSQDNAAIPPPGSYPSRSSGLVSPPPTHSDRAQSLAGNTGSGRAHGDSVQSQIDPLYATRMQPSGQGPTDGLLPWPSSASSTDGTLMDLPSWVTIDFDFEQAFTGHGNGDKNSFTGAETFDFDNTWAQTFGSSM